MSRRAYWYFSGRIIKYLSVEVIQLIDTKTTFLAFVLGLRCDICLSLLPVFLSLDSTKNRMNKK